MTDEKTTVAAQTDAGSEKKTSTPYSQWILFALIAAALISFALRNPQAARTIFLVAVGFGSVVMIHELGHFIVAKLGGIKVEAFSVGFPPVVFGVRKLKKGFRFRFLPKPGAEQTLNDGDSPTEYQIGLVPLGGFVKMLGQSDSGPVEQTEDPRSFNNRPIWIRIAVVAAGVTFNAIGAMLMFMALFLHGIDLKPAVVGDVVPHSPAYEAGLRPGDKIVEINGERFVDFEAVVLAPALSGKGETISMTVQRPDGEQKIKVVAERAAGDTTGLRSIGISEAHTLTIEPKIARDAELLAMIFEQTGFRPGDEIKAVNGQPVTSPWDLTQKIREALSSQAVLTVSRSWPAGSPKTQENLTFEMRVGPTVSNFRQENDLAHIYGLVPCLRVSAVLERPQAVGMLQRLMMRLGKSVEQPQSDMPALVIGDLITRIGQTPYPNFKQLRDITTEHKNKPLELAVLRANAAGDLEAVTLTVYPYEVPGSNRVTIGIAAELAMGTPIVAQTLDGGMPGAALELPQGARIVSIDGQPVNDFYAIAQRLTANRGQRVSIDYVAEGAAGGTGLTVPQRGGLRTESSLTAGIPYEAMMLTFKADKPLEAIGMGLKKAQQFVMRTVITLYRLFRKEVPSSSLVGPVGIIKVSYTIADSSLIHYLYFLGLIGSCLAVMNLLPLPVLDGGVIVMLLIEKISGKPIPEKVQGVISYIGLALLLSLMLWVTYNDILRILFG